MITDVDVGGLRFASSKRRPSEHERPNCQARRGAKRFAKTLKCTCYLKPPFHFYSVEFSDSCQRWVRSRSALPGIKCSPKGKFLGLIVNGRRVSFAENVFYEFKLSKIASVWSVIDKAAIEAQLAG